MTKIMAVTFQRHGALHYLEADRDYRVGEKVLFPTPHGPEVAECVWPPTQIQAGDVPMCLGPASRDDLARDELNRSIRANAKAVTNRLVIEHGLKMKVVAVDFIDQSEDFDRLVVIYFTAPQRVDFRTLLLDLGRALRARIDLRQVGGRDAARLVGGVGMCGLDYCCTTFLDDLDPITHRMAKVQIPSNLLNISGACGRMLCCLRFEHTSYVEFFRTAPRVGMTVQIRDEGDDAVVVGHRVPDDTVLLKLATGEQRRCPVRDIRCTKAPKPKRPQ